MPWCKLLLDGYRVLLSGESTRDSLVMWDLSSSNDFVLLTLYAAAAAAYVFLLPAAVMSRGREVLWRGIGEAGVLTLEGRDGVLLVVVFRRVCC